jgi:hypothetical protein
MNRSAFAWLAAAAGIAIAEESIRGSATMRDIPVQRRTEEDFENESRLMRQARDEQDAIRAKYRAERAARKAAAFARRQPRQDRIAKCRQPNAQVSGPGQPTKGKQE